MVENRSIVVKDYLMGAAAAGMIALGFAGTAAAERMITVNGLKLSAVELVMTDHKVGVRLPNGHYYCDPWSGFWGVLGEQPMGRVSPAECPTLPGYGSARGIEASGGGE
jgi:hypothetical protein